MPIVVGRLAAQTPARLSVFSSMFSATTSGGAQAKQAVSPGRKNWMCPETAFSDTPDSNQCCDSSLHAVLMAMRASKLSTQLSTRSTGVRGTTPPLLIASTNWLKLSTVVML
uniref:Putative secreted peptide n=1 Tax=Anopheles braziliensis TaxID=58242 RepID=A0A2M3ZR12_9DIPT